VQVALVVTAVLVGLRVALPQLVQDYVNKKLDEMPEYVGGLAMSICIFGAAPIRFRVSK
jgi:hypothetical protein